MLSRHKKAAKRTVTFLVVGLIFAMFAPSAFAECGPGFSSKSQLIRVVKQNPSLAHGIRKKLLAEQESEYSADETVLNYLRESSQKVEKAPAGYKLKTNTWCPGGYGDYHPYGGLLGNMSGKAMLWHCNKNGECIPLLKGYCMNFVTGPPVRKHRPKKHKPRKPKCGCKHPKKHKKRPKKVVCKSGEVMIGNACSPQTNNQEQECKAKSGYTWNSATMTCVQNAQNGVCTAQSGVINGSGNTVNQSVECGPKTEVKVEVVTPPPTPEPEPEPKPEPEKPMVSWERIQESVLEETRPLCVTATPTSIVSGVQFEVEWGQKSNGGVGIYNASTNKFCVTYTAPTAKPPHVCVEPIAEDLPPGTKCDIAKVLVATNNGAESVRKTMEIPIVTEEEREIFGNNRKGNMNKIY